MIRLADKFFRNDPKFTYAELICTIFHEMIHALQWQIGVPLDHGWFFWKVATKVGMW